jgi:hypothetical protein
MLMLTARQLRNPAYFLSKAGCVKGHHMHKHNDDVAMCVTVCYAPDMSQHTHVPQCEVLHTSTACSRPRACES